MLEANGRQVLQIIGKEPNSNGIILPEQMPAAIAALQMAVEQQEADQKEAVMLAKNQGDPPPEFTGLSLRKRVWPVVDILQRCHRESASITWGV